MSSGKKSSMLVGTLASAAETWFRFSEACRFEGLLMLLMETRGRSLGDAWSSMGLVAEDEEAADLRGGCFDAEGFSDSIFLLTLFK